VFEARGPVLTDLLSVKLRADKEARDRCREPVRHVELVAALTLAHVRGVVHVHGQVVKARHHHAREHQVGGLRPHLARLGHKFLRPCL
jgi:hypothetical protein